MTTATEQETHLSLSNLATAMYQLGQAEGTRRVVQFSLTDRQVMALNTLGFKPEATKKVDSMSKSD